MDLIELAKVLAAIGGIIILLGTLVGIYIPFMGLWYISSPLGSAQNYGWFDVLGVYHWVSLSHFIDQTEPHQTVQIVGYIILAGGLLTFLGGLIGVRSITLIGIIVTIIGIAIFVISLQAVLDTDSFFPLGKPYNSGYSIYFTLNQSLLIGGPLTQTLGGGFFACIIGILLGFAGTPGMKK